MANPYHVLGVQSTASDDEIKKIYKKLARKLHPDRNPSPDAEKRFKKINEAYDVLSDPEKRKLYDQFGEVAFKPGFNADAARQWGHQGAGGFRGGFGGFGADGFSGGGMDDILGSIFRGGGGAPHQRQARGHDQHMRIAVPAMTTFIGGVQEIAITRPTGQVDRMKLKIEAGTLNGDKLRLKGKGLPPRGGGPCGDLVVQVDVTEHSSLRREGRDLHLDVPVTLREAFEGGPIEVPTATGVAKVTLPPACANKRLRLRGRGVQFGKDPGHLVITLRVALPDQASAEDLEPLLEIIDSAYSTEVRAKLDW